MEEEDEVDGPVAFFKRLSVEEIADLLFETTLSTWDYWWHNPVTCKPRLWPLSRIVKKISREEDLFGELNRLCDGSVCLKARMAMTGLDGCISISTFCAILAWLGPKCKLASRESSRAICEDVAQIIQPIVYKIYR